MHFGTIINVQLTHEMPEVELDDFIEDLNAFRMRCRISGKLRGMPNYVFNIYDETDYNEASEKFSGSLRIYFETDERDAKLIDDIKFICDRYEGAITQLVRKWII